MSDLMDILTFVAVLGSALVAGIFFAFSTFISSSFFKIFVLTLLCLARSTVQVWAASVCNKGIG